MEKDRAPQLDKAGLRCAAEMRGKASSTPLVLRLECVSGSCGQPVRTDCWVHARVSDTVAGVGPETLPPWQALVLLAGDHSLRAKQSRGSRSNKHLNKGQVWLINALERCGVKMELVRIFWPALNRSYLTSPFMFQLRKMETMSLLKYQMLIEPRCSLTHTGVMSLPKVPKRYRSGSWISCQCSVESKRIHSINTTFLRNISMCIKYPKSMKAFYYNVSKRWLFKSCCM